MREISPIRFFGDSDRFFPAGKPATDRGDFRAIMVPVDTPEKTVPAPAPVEDDADVVEAGDAAPKVSPVTEPASDLQSDSPEPPTTTEPISPPALPASLAFVEKDKKDQDEQKLPTGNH